MTTVPPTNEVLWAQETGAPQSALDLVGPRLCRLAPWVNVLRVGVGQDPGRVRLPPGHTLAVLYLTTNKRQARFVGSRLAHALDPNVEPEPEPRLVERPGYQQAYFV